MSEPDALPAALLEEEFAGGYIEIQLVDQLYAKAYNHFRVSNVFCILYSIAKVIGTPIVLFISSFYHVTMIVWLWLLLAFSAVQIVYYIAARLFSKNMEVYMSVAEKLRHSAYFSAEEISAEARQTRIHDQIYSFANPAAVANDRQFRMLSFQIKFQVLRKSPYLKVISRIMFFIYQGLHIWGFVIFFTETDESVASDYMIVILFLGTYQYFEFYSLIILIVIVAPFLLIYMGIKAYRKKIKQEAIARRLQGQKFRADKIKGDHTCNICMDDYREEDLITVLACNQLHHFHQPCLAEWIRVSNTCPMCRQQIEN